MAPTPEVARAIRIKVYTMMVIAIVGALGIGALIGNWLFANADPQTIQAIIKHKY